MRYYVSSASACADPGIFTKWGGGGGVEGPVPPDSKKLGQRFLLFLLFFLSSPSTYLTVLQRGLIPGSDDLFFGKQ